MSLRWSALDDKSLVAWSELTGVLAKSDGIEDTWSPEDLAEELRAPNFDRRTDSWAVWDGDQLVAFGQLRVRDALREGRAHAWLAGGVHPDWRREGIGNRLLDLMQDRAADLCAERHPGREIILSAEGGLDGAPVRPLLERRGYELVRYFHHMRRAYPGAPLPEPAHPVELYQPAFSEVLHRAHNEAFSTHFRFAPSSDAEWIESMQTRSLRADASYVLRGDDGAIKAYVVSYCHVLGELYIGRVGTVQAERGHGYARACLLACLRAGLEQGYSAAELDVDSTNPTGAGALYESMGFARTKTLAFYERTVPARG
jgi:ribosomal protein S18 acetylase RimI-like enzyme